jgi:hypothetical protein
MYIIICVCVFVPLVQVWNRLIDVTFNLLQLIIATCSVCHNSHKRLKILRRCEILGLCMMNVI